MNTTMVRYVGLDVHKRVVQACIVDQAGKVVHREMFARTLETFATEILRPTDHVVPRPRRTSGMAEAMLAAAWGDVTRFPDGDHAASYLGLVPSTKQSADQLLPRPDHQARQQPRPLDAHRGRAAPGQASRPAGPLLPPPVPQEEPQRGRGGRCHRLADGEWSKQAGCEEFVDRMARRRLCRGPSGQLRVPLLCSGAGLWQSIWFGIWPKSGIGGGVEPVGLYLL